MADVTELTNQLQGGIGSSYDRARQRVLVAEWQGRISSIDRTGRYEVLGTGYGNLEDIEMIPGATAAIVTQRDGSVFRVNLDNANRADARVITTALVAPHQVVVDGNRRAYIVEFSNAGRLVLLDLRTGQITTVTTGLRRAVGLALSANKSLAYVTEQLPAGGQLTEIVVETGQRTVVASGLVAPFMLEWDSDDRTALLIAERNPANRITRAALRKRTAPLISTDLLNNVVTNRLRRDSVIDLSSELVRSRSRTGGNAGANLGNLTRERNTDLRDNLDLRNIERLRSRATLTRLLDPAPQSPSSIQRTDFGIVVIADRIATLVEEAQPATVEFDVGGPLFPGTYRDVPVKLQGGIGFDDVDFSVVPGPEIGQVSFSRDDRFDPLNPTVMLLAGPQFGDGQLIATRRSDGSIVGEAELKTIDVWKGEEGPPVWFEGTSQPAVLGATWGGGSPEPQNHNIVPQSGPWRVAVVLIDTSDGRFPADASATVTKWRNETADGVPQASGPDRSAKQFFREVGGMMDDGSGTMVPRLDLQLDDVYGPLSLDGEWTDYFEPISDTDSRWVFKSALFQAAASAADDSIDFSQIDSLVVVAKTAPETAAGAGDMKRAWPFAWGTNLSTDEGDVDMRVVVMPDDWDAAGSREIYETLSHELAHNLGLPDIYMSADGFGDALEARDLDGWDTMSWEGNHSHFNAAFKLRLGWIDIADVQTFDFSVAGRTSEELVLHASSLGKPPAGRFSAVEVRIADGWNYYFEYRSEQDDHTADEDLPTDRRVVGTDVVLPDFRAPITRRQVILVPDDIDGDGPILDVGEDFEELDASSPTAPADFRVDVLETDEEWARIRVSYGTTEKPDPSIRPWPRSGTNAWQSPDIEVFNAKNEADASFKNLPWTGHSNRIVARVRNLGGLDATGVRMNFSVKDFTVGDPIETPLGFDIKDIPAGGTVDFEFDGWVPPAGEHFCIVANMPLHVNSDVLGTAEITELNNRAQSNYSEFISAEASPPSRERTTITVANPYPATTTVYLKPVQTNPFYRTYLAASSVRLAPGEERGVEMMFEALHNTPDMSRLLQEDKSDELLGQPNYVAIEGSINDPLDPEHHHPLPTGGATVRVRTGMGTRVNASVDGDVVSGRVSSNDGKEVESGQVIVTLRPAGAPVQEEQAFVAEVSQGFFFVEVGFDLQSEPFEGSVEYLGFERWAPSPSFTLTP